MRKYINIKHLNHTNFPIHTFPITHRLGELVGIFWSQLQMGFTERLNKALHFVAVGQNALVHIHMTCAICLLSAPHCRGTLHNHHVHSFFFEQQLSTLEDLEQAFILCLLSDNEKSKIT